MRILFWSETFWPRVGGVENLAARLLPALQARGHEFVVVTWEHVDSPDEIRYRGIPIHRFAFFTGGPQALDRMMDNRRLVAKLKKDYSPDLVHINSYGRSILFHATTSGAHPAPVLVTLHQALAEEPVDADSLLGHILRNADWINTCSESVLARAKKLFPEIITRSSVIHNALEAPTFDPRPIFFDPPRLLCLGRLEPEKGFDLALTAFARVLDRFPGARLVIAGAGSQRRALEQQASRLNLTSSVEFCGPVSTEAAARLIEHATLVVVPSRLEGFGLVALEAAWLGRPVIAAQVGGLPEVVVHAETGWLTESDNGTALAEAIEFLLEQPEKIRRMGRAARVRAQTEFSWERYVDHYDALYRRLGQDKTQPTFRATAPQKK
jgi:glycosyltransferase involved in cell wall biosynthesis